MPATNTKAGRMPCQTCKDPVWVKKTGGGKLSYRCEGCDSTAYAEAGGRAFRKWSSTMTPHVDPDAEPAPAPSAPAAPPKPPRRQAAPTPPAPAAPASVFSFGLG